MHYNDRHLGHWRNIIVLWLPIEWAGKYTLERVAERLGSDAVYDVFSYVFLPPETKYNRTNHPIFEAIVPSELQAGMMLKTSTRGERLHGRVRLPRPGNIESCGLVRPYAMSNGEFKTRLNNHLDFRTVPAKVHKKVMELTPGLSTAYQLSDRATIGRIELKKPMDLHWERGQLDDELAISTIQLKDDSYVRIFPALESERDKIKPIYRWPYFWSVCGFSRIPMPGSTSRCLVRWMMARDGRPVGHAFPV